eukprot:366091_1
MMTSATQSNVTLNNKRTWHFAAIHNDSLHIIRLNASEILFESMQLPLNIHRNWTTEQYHNPISTSYIQNVGDCSVQIGNKLFVINAIDAYDATATSRTYNTFAYNLDSNEFLIMDPSQTPLDGTCIVYSALNHIIYVRGASGQYLNLIPELQRFNVSSMKWIDAGAAPSPRYRTGCALNANSDQVYYFGGQILNTLPLTAVPVDVIDKYDIATNTWHNITDTLSVSRYSLKCRLLSVHQHIYCIGGSTGTTGGLYSLQLISNVVDVFDTAQEAVLKNITMFSPRYGFTATLWNDARCIIICGSGLYWWSPSLDIEYIGDCLQSFAYINTTAPSSPTTTATTSISSTKTPETSVKTSKMINTEETGVFTPATTDESYPTSVFESVLTTNMWTVTNNTMLSHSNHNEVEFWIIVMVMMSVLILCVISGCCYSFLTKTKAQNNDMDQLKIQVDDIQKQNAEYNEHTHDMEIEEGVMMSKVNGTTHKRVNNNALEVQYWLQNLVQLPQHYDTFIDNGYDSLQIIKEISSAFELIEIGITVEAHHVKLFREIDELKHITQNLSNQRVSMLSIEGNNIMMMTQEGM